MPRFVVVSPSGREIPVFMPKGTPPEQIILQAQQIEAQITQQTQQVRAQAQAQGEKVAPWRGDPKPVAPAMPTVTTPQAAPIAPVAPTAQGPLAPATPPAQPEGKGPDHGYLSFLDPILNPVMQASETAAPYGMMLAGAGPAATAARGVLPAVGRVAKAGAIPALAYGGGSIMEKLGMPPWLSEVALLMSLGRGRGVIGTQRQVGKPMAKALRKELGMAPAKGATAGPLKPPAPKMPKTPTNKELLNAAKKSMVPGQGMPAPEALGSMSIPPGPGFAAGPMATPPVTLPLGTSIDDLLKLL
jgi:hypothetical protein